MRFAGEGDKKIGPRSSSEPMAISENPKRSCIRRRAIPPALSALLGVIVFRIELEYLLQVLLCQGRLRRSLVRQSQVIVEGRIVRIPLDRLFEQVDRSWIESLLVVGPSQRIGGVRVVGHLPARGLCHGERDVDIAALLQHHVGQVV